MAIVSMMAAAVSESESCMILTQAGNADAIDCPPWTPPIQ